MKTHVRKSIPFGDLVVAAFDRAAQYRSDSDDVSRLAVRALLHVLRHTPGVSISLSPQTAGTSAAE